MPCYHPLYAIPDVNPRTGEPFKTKNGKTRYKILGNYDPQKDSIVHGDLIQLPCGRCIGCRLEYSRQWANRLMLEREYHDSAYFVTFTYNDFFVPRAYYPDPETGEALTSLTLSKVHWQLLMKRVRKMFPDDQLRFYVSGEYGTDTMRPHFHAIIFGLHLDDLQLKATDQRGFRYYRSPKLEYCWSVSPDKGSIISPYMTTVEDILQKVKEDGNSPYLIPEYPGRVRVGYVTIADVTWETCAYTARYVTKKLCGDDARFYSDFNLVPPFSLMSRRPGIARQWYEDHPGWSDYDYINIKTGDGGRKVNPPKYFERLLGEDDPDLAAQRSEIRAARAKASLDAKLSKTDLSYGQYLEVCEDIKSKRTKSLKRGL
jgi:hypothetical protein